MSTKHKPATPLPWKSLGGSVRDAKGIATDDDVGRDPTLLYCVTANQHEDAAYIAHAANAYPQLIEALRTWDRAVTNADMQKAFQSAQLLLRKLGEE